MSQPNICTLDQDEQGLLHQALVHIGVTEDKKIHVYPRREGDTVIYNAWNPAAASPAKPHEVRWIVSGLKKNQQIRIEAKDGQGEYFEASSFLIPPDLRTSTNTHTSGRPKLDGRTGRTLHWSYSVVLLEDGAEVVGSRVDPDIEIKDDP